MRKLTSLWLKTDLLAVTFLLLPLTARGQHTGTEVPDGTAVGRHGMVATAHPLASLAAVQMLQKGGNAVDAAVAAAFATGVVEPDGSGLGGGGGMLIYLADQKRSVYINYYQQAPSRVLDVSYTPSKDAQTAKAILVPGTVAGLTLALREFGTLPLPTVLAPAIRYAEAGFPLDATLSRILLDNVALVQKHPATAAVYLRDGFPLMEGDTLFQPELGRTLRVIAAEGPNTFYHGSIAHTIADEIKRSGGVMSAQDLAGYTAEIVAPLHGTYRGFEIVSAPPPHSGAFIIEALNIVEHEDLRSLGHYADSARALHLLVETLRRVYADRTAFLADPAFEQVPVSGLLDKEYARSRLEDINREFAEPREYRKTKSGNPLEFEGVDRRKPGVGGKAGSMLRRHGKSSGMETAAAGEGDGHTTHLCVIDANGNTVSLTQTLGTFFGSGVTAAGVLLNNARSNFSSTTRRNAPQPGKRPRSSISPTILLKDGSPFLAVGSPGSSRIIAAVFEVILNIVDYGMPLAEANAAPRFHAMKLDDYLHVESRISSAVRDDMDRRGHTLRVYGAYDLFFGGAQIILVDPDTGQLTGSADPRRGGAASGF